MVEKNPACKFQLLPVRQEQSESWGRLHRSLERGKSRDGKDAGDGVHRRATGSDDDRSQSTSGRAARQRPTKKGGDHDLLRPNWREGEGGWKRVGCNAVCARVNGRITQKRATTRATIRSPSRRARLLVAASHMNWVHLLMTQSKCETVPCC